MDKTEVLDLAAVHDKRNQYWINQEKEIGEKIRQNRELTKKDLERIIEKARIRIL